MSGINFRSAKSVMDALGKLFSARTTPAPPIAPPMILRAAARPGLSPSKIAARVIARKAEAGAPIGALPDGSDSVDEKIIRIMMEELVRAMVEDMRITIAFPPGVAIQGGGANAGGPIVVQGVTVTIGSGYGVAQ